MVGRFAYTPFGDLAAQDGERPPFLFNGRDGVITDANGLCDMRARRYRPAQLRFLERDFLLGDLGVPQSLAPYAYVIGDPIQLVDPLGLSHSSGWKRFGIGIGIAAGVVLTGAAMVGTLVMTGAEGGAGIAAAGSAIEGGTIARIGQDLTRFASWSGKGLIDFGNRIGVRIVFRIGNFMQGLAEGYAPDAFPTKTL